MELNGPFLAKVTLRTNIAQAMRESCEIWTRSEAVWSHAASPSRDNASP